MAGFFEEAVTKLAWWGNDAAEVSIQENDAQLLAGWEDIARNPDLSPEKRAIAEREIAKLKASPAFDVDTGNGQLFVDAAAEAGKNAINTVGATIWKTIPWWIWALLAVGLIGYFGFLFAPTLRAKGVIR